MHERSSFFPSLPVFLPPSLPSQVQVRTAKPSGREDEVLERRKATVELVDPLFHLTREERERGWEGGREGGRLLKGHSGKAKT